MPRAVVAVALAAGCRIGFTDQAQTVSDATEDAPADAQIVTRTFGERPGSNTTGVTIDAMIAVDRATMNFGLAEDISLYGGGTIERGLVRFELSSIPPDTPVIGARLELELIDFGDNINAGLSLRRAGEAWTETAVTWNERVAGTAWTFAGGTASGILSSVPTPTTNQVMFTVPASLVQSWIDAPATNFGFIVGGADDLLDGHYHLASSEAALLTARPLLVLDLAEY